MTKVPFHRRVYLWVIIVAFFILAPALVFYTSGFRWNAKKGIIERNGTLIIDTQPAGAMISLNGETIASRTPVTLQNAAPGTYRIRLEYPGYASWEKTLEVRPSFVTFVNEVRLWRNGSPERAWDRPTSAIALSPNARAVATVEQQSDDEEWRLVFRTVPVTGGLFSNAQEADARVFEGGAPTGTVRMQWNAAGTAVLIADDAGREWFGDRDANGQRASLLPVGEWRWDENALMGLRPASTDGKRRAEQSEMVTRTGAAKLTILPWGVVDQNETYAVMTSTGTVRLSVVRRGDEERRFELPTGSWTIAQQMGAWLFLTDGNEWLGFDPSHPDASSIRIPSDVPLSFLKQGRATLYLSHGGGELWEGTLGQPAELLLRASEMITDAKWHPDGTYVLYSTPREIIVLGLDARDGRSRNTLATFNRVYGFVEAEGIVYVAGVHEGVSGVWSLPIE
jgi:hypothetical protein